MENFIIVLSGRSKHGSIESLANRIAGTGGICEKHISNLTSVVVAAGYPNCKQTHRTRWANKSRSPIVSDDDLVDVLNTGRPLSDLLERARKYENLAAKTPEQIIRDKRDRRMNKAIASAAPKIASRFDVCF